MVGLGPKGDPAIRRYDSGPQPHQRRAPAAAVGGRLLETQDVRAAREVHVHAVALHAAPAPVDDAHLAQSALGGRLEIGVDELADVARREVVEVERVADRDLDRLAGKRLILVFRHADRTVTSRSSSPLEDP